jgi:hypothetical protein
LDYPQYYENLDRRELEEKPMLIVMIEAAWYCESNNAKFIRYFPLKIRSNKCLSRITGGKRSDLGGGFDSVIKTLSNPLIAKKERFLTRRHKKIGGRMGETRFYPNITLIQREIKRRQAENLESGKWRLVSISKNDRVHRSRSLPLESVPISEMLCMSVLRASK